MFHISPPIHSSPPPERPRYTYTRNSKDALTDNQAMTMIAVGCLTAPIWIPVLAIYGLFKWMFKR